MNFPSNALTAPARVLQGAARIGRPSAGDGYTLLEVGANNAINATLYDKLGFDLLRDFAPVAGIYRVSQVMLIRRRRASPWQLHRDALFQPRMAMDHVQCGNARATKSGTPGK